MLRTWLPTSAIVSLGATAASAQTQPDIERDANTALEAAIRGDCDAAIVAASRVEVADAAYWRAHLATHPALAACDPRLVSALAVEQPVPVGNAIPVEQPALPELSGGRILGELAVGTVGGAVGLIVGALAGALVGEGIGDEAGGAVIGGYTGMALGLPLGVHLVASYGDQAASLGATLAGSLIPAAVGGGLIVVAASTSRDELLGLGVGIGFVGPMIGALVACNATRRWDAAAMPAVVPTISPSPDGAMFGIAGAF